MNTNTVVLGICEDNTLHRRLLFDYLSKCFNALSINYDIFEFSSRKELLNKYPNNIDLLFLDIQMSDLNGMDTARKIREFDNNVEIIFTTSLLDYACEG